MGVLNHLIAPKRASKRPARRPPAASRRSPLGGLLLPQFDRLGLPLGAVPSVGPAGSAWSRAYILGAACATLQQQDAAPVSDQECFAAALAAFAMTYGEADARVLMAETIAAAEANEPDVEDGLLHGATDLALVALHEADPATLHFAKRNAAELVEAI